MWGKGNMREQSELAETAEREEGHKGEMSRVGGATQVGGAAWVGVLQEGGACGVGVPWEGGACGGAARVGALPWGSPWLHTLEYWHWQQQSVHWALRVYWTALQLRTGRHHWPHTYD
jgi:hypothetical protein